MTIEARTSGEQYRPTRRAVMTGLAAAGLSMRVGPADLIGTRTINEGNDHMAETIERLLRENLYGVFGEHDAEKRRRNIAQLWAEDGVFVDHNSRYEGHAGIDHAVAGLVKKFPNFVFRERGEPQAFNGVGKIDWGFGPAGAEIAIMGIDVLVMKGDKIGALYTFLDPPKKHHSD